MRMVVIWCHKPTIITLVESSITTIQAMVMCVVMVYITAVIITDIVVAMDITAVDLEVILVGTVIDNN
jgi:hypothetical protein